MITLTPITEVYADRLAERDAQIASLTAENERLREALNKIEDGTAFSLVHPVPIYGMGSDLEDGYFIAADFARAALQPKEAP